MRGEIIGPTPRSRNDVHQIEFLDIIYGDKNNIVVCDSDDLHDGWRDEINKVNSNSDYDWSKLNDDMRNLEEEYHQTEDDEASINAQSEADEGGSSKVG